MLVLRCWLLLVGAGGAAAAVVSSGLCSARVQVLQSALGNLEIRGGQKAGPFLFAFLLLKPLLKMALWLLLRLPLFILDIAATIILVCLLKCLFATVFLLDDLLPTILQVAPAPLLPELPGHFGTGVVRFRFADEDYIILHTNHISHSDNVMRLKAWSGGSRACSKCPDFVGR